MIYSTWQTWEGESLQTALVPSGWNKEEDEDLPSNTSQLPIGGGRYEGYANLTKAGATTQTPWNDANSCSPAFSQAIGKTCLLDLTARRQTIKIFLKALEAAHEWLPLAAQTSLYMAARVTDKQYQSTSGSDQIQSAPQAFRHDRAVKSSPRCEDNKIMGISCPSDIPLLHASKWQIDGFTPESSSTPLPQSKSVDNASTSTSHTNNTRKLRHRISISSTISVDFTTEYHTPCRSSQDGIISASRERNTTVTAKDLSNGSFDKLGSPIVVSHKSEDNRIAQPQDRSGVALGPDRQLRGASLPLSRPNSRPVEADNVVLRDPYRNPIILQCRDNPFKPPIQLFQHSESAIPSNLDTHFRNIVNGLLQNLECESKTSAACEHLDFKLWYAGSSVRDAYPSVIVICREEILSQVEEVLCSRHILRQHNLVTQSSNGLRQRLLRRVTRSSSRVDRPRFYLLFVARRMPPRQLLAGRVINSMMVLEDASNLIWSGTKISRSQDGLRATLACVLQLGEDLYGLTTAHGFENKINDAISSFVVTDSEPTLSPCQMIIPEHESKSVKLPNLDWALIRMQDRRQWAPFFKCHNSKVQDIGTMALRHPGKERKVLILSSISTKPQTGILLCGITYSRAASGDLPVGTWSVELGYNQELQKGDSGSLVIDASTYAIYGYIVALDFRGLAQVMPMSATISQIESTMHMKNVKILGIDKCFPSSTTVMPSTSMQRPGTLSLDKRSYMVDDHATTHSTRCHNAEDTLQRTLHEEVLRQHLESLTPYLECDEIQAASTESPENGEFLSLLTPGSSESFGNSSPNHQDTSDLISFKNEEDEVPVHDNNHQAQPFQSNFPQHTADISLQRFVIESPRSSSKKEDHGPDCETDFDHQVQRQKIHQLGPSFLATTHQTKSDEPSKSGNVSSIYAEPIQLEHTPDVPRKGASINGKRKFDNMTQQRASCTESYRQLSYSDYTVGWICALPVELIAARTMLDEEHLSLSQPNDNFNVYTLGSVNHHNVVVVCLPPGVYGSQSTAKTTSETLLLFPNISVFLLVGIAGGVPSSKHDIRLGDIVVSTPGPDSPAVVQYDFGKAPFKGSFTKKGPLEGPPPALLKACIILRSEHQMNRSKIGTYITNALQKVTNNEADYAYPGSAVDILYESKCEHTLADSICQKCGPRKEVIRAPRPNETPIIHYGTIGSGNCVIKDGRTRDKLAQESDILCFEMEAAGLMNRFPILVVRGICDYCDSFKHKGFQGYAALAAAAYAKDLLSNMLTQRAFIGIQHDNLQNKTLSSNDLQRQIKHRADILATLDFDDAYVRRDTIRQPSPGTCNWLLQKQEYIDWLDQSKIPEHNGFLWLKGKPGAGKSTLMKHMLVQTKSAQSDDSLTASFFFNARGSDLEKSIVGAYRSILSQLMLQAPRLQIVLDSYANTHPETWRFDILQNIFQQTMQQLGSTQVFCFIDALDECTEDQMRDLLLSLEDLGQLAVTNNTHFHVCVSSRHYPNVSVRAGVQLILEFQDGHSCDIQRYIATKLRIGKTKHAQAIKAEVLSKSGGIFLWVVLVIQILNTEHDRGRVHALRNRLSDIPVELNNLFLDICTRDNHDLEELVLCMQWILFATRPLRREELFFALLAKSRDLLPWNGDELSSQIMDHYILNCSKGLAEITRTKQPTVQFIHESITEFLQMHRIPTPGFKDITPVESHRVLRNFCYQYLELSNQKVIVDLIQQQLSPAELRGKIWQLFPFLEYAVEHVLVHAEELEKLQSSQLIFLDEFPTTSWIQLHNIIQRYKVRRYAPRTSLVYILAKLGLPYLVALALQNLKIFDSESALGFEGLIFMALDDTNDKNRSAFKTLCKICDGHVIPLHHDEALYVVTVDYLQAVRAAKSGALLHPQTLPLVTRLLQSWPEKDQKLLNDIFLDAASLRHKEMVLFLLEHGANINTADDCGDTALSIVSRHTHLPRRRSKLQEEQDDVPSILSMLKLLLANGARLEMSNSIGKRPLHVAVQNSTASITKLLLDEGASTEASDNDGCTPLHLACHYGNVDIVRQLLESGAWINAKNKECISPLYEAAAQGNIELVKLLTYHGADIEAETLIGWTALQAAIHGNHVVVARFLLELGAKTTIPTSETMLMKMTGR